MAKFVQTSPSPELRRVGPFLYHMKGAGGVLFHHAFGTG